MIIRTKFSNFAPIFLGLSGLINPMQTPDLQNRSEASEDEIITTYGLSADFFYPHHQGTQDEIGRCWTFANDTDNMQVLKLIVPGRFQGLETLAVIIKPGELVSFNRKPRLWINSNGIQFSYHYISGARLNNRGGAPISMDPAQVTKLNTYISQHLDDTQGSIEQKYAHQAAIRIKRNRAPFPFQSIDSCDKSEKAFFDRSYHLWLPIRQIPQKTVPERLQKTALQTLNLFTFGDRLTLATNLTNLIATTLTEGAQWGLFRAALLCLAPATTHLLGSQNPMVLLAALRSTLEKRSPTANSPAAHIIRCINTIESSTGQTYQDKQKHMAQIVRTKLRQMQKNMQLQEGQAQQVRIPIFTQQTNDTHFDWHQATIRGSGRCWIFSNHTNNPQTLALRVPHRLYGAEEITVTIAPASLVSFNRKPHIVPFGSLGLHTYVCGAKLHQTNLAPSEVKKLNEYIAHHLNDSYGSRENPQAYKAAILIENEQSLRSHEYMLNRAIKENELVQFNNGYYLFLPTETIKKRPLHAHITEPAIEVAKQVGMPLGYAIWSYSLSPLWYASGKFVDLFMSLGGNQNFADAQQKLIELLQDAEIASRTYRRHANSWLPPRNHNNISPIESLSVEERHKDSQKLQGWINKADKRTLFATRPDLFENTVQYAHAALAGSLK